MDPLHRFGFALLLFATACGRAAPDGRASETTLPNGAVLVRSPAEGSWTDAERWTLAPDGALPDPAGEPLAFPAALEADADGTLYVLDAVTQRVHVYDAEGRHVRSFGGGGGGPGEFKQAFGMALAPDGALWVADPGSLRYTAFGPDGTVLATHRRDALALHPWPGRFDAAGNLWDVDAAAGGAGAGLALLRLAEPGGRPERFDLPPFSREQFTLDRGASKTSAFVPFAPELVWALSPEGRVWSGVSAEYRLALHEPGGDTLRVAELELPPVPVAAADREAAAGMLRWFADQGGQVDLSRLPRNKPAFTAIHVDDRGYLWVRPSLPAGEARTAFDVLDPEARYLGRVWLPAVLPENVPVRVRGDRLYAVVPGEDDVPRVVRFRIQGRGAAEARVADRR